MRAFSTWSARPPSFAARAPSALAGLVGISALVGWTFDIPALKSGAPGFIAMQPWTATAMLLAAAALWMAASSTRAARLASAVPTIVLVAVVAAPLLEYATGGDLGTDIWLFPKAVLNAQTVPYPDLGRMSLATSTGLVTLAGALLLAPRVQRPAGRAVFSLLASVGLSLTLMTLVGYILRIESLDRVLHRNQIALPTAIALAALCAGVLALRPDAGWVRLVAAQGNPGWAAAALLLGAGMLLVFGSEAAVTAGMVARGVSEAGLKLETLRSTIVDAETGQRGYLLTGKEIYLQPYTAASARLPRELAAAEASLALVDSAPAELAGLRDSTREKMTELAESIALRRAGDVAGALAIVNRDSGKELMDGIRSMADGFVPTMTATGHSNGAHAESAAATAALGAIGLGGLAFWSLIAAGRVRREAGVTIAESEARQRDLLATLSLGTFMARDLTGAIRYWAEGCARLYGWTADEAIGQPANELLRTIFPIPLPEIEAALDQKGEWVGDLRHRTRDGRQLLVTAHKVMRRSTPEQRAVVLEFLTDVTALRHAEAALAKTQALMLTVIETTPGLIYAKDLDGRMILSNSAVVALINKPGIALHGRTDRELLDDPEQADAVMKNDRRVMESGVSQQFEERTGEVGGQARVWLSTKAPMRDAAGKVVGMVGVSIEITERKQAEDRQRLMVDELSHRVKNTLVTVQAIAAQTLRGADPAIFEALEGRLQALATVHDVLTRESWKDVGLHEVIGNALAPFAVPGKARFEISGPPMRLAPRVAVTLSMAVHELATNALKYGAWSIAAGQVGVRWEITSGAEPRLRMTWSEAHGPSVAPPLVRGFGTRMIERTLAHDLGGSAKVAFHAAGVVCSIDAPLAEIVASAGDIALPRVDAMQGAEKWA